MKLTKLFAAAGLIAFTGIAAIAQETVPASDTRITFVGRTLVSADTVSFDWSATYAKIKFEGKSLTMKASDTKKNYYDVWIDATTGDKPTKKITVTGKDTTIAICTPEDLVALYGKQAAKKASVHNVIIKKRTEGEQGLTSISEFSTDGKMLQAEGLKPRMMEFIGDSYTCGYGTEGTNVEPFTPETENSNLTYAAVLARYFDADYITACHSGRGIARNYADVYPTVMPDKYPMVFDEESRTEKWDPSTIGFKPQVTVIYLCTNDFSVGKQPSFGAFQAKYNQLLQEVKEYHGIDHPILCISSKWDNYIAQYVREVVEKCGLSNVWYAGFTPAIHNNGAEDIGAGGHPNYNGHIKKAYALLPYISTLTGWSLEQKILK